MPMASIARSLVGTTAALAPRPDGTQEALVPPSRTDLSEAPHWSTWKLVSQQLLKGVWRPNPVAQGSQHSWANLGQ